MNPILRRTCPKSDLSKTLGELLKEIDPLDQTFYKDLLAPSSRLTELVQALRDDVYAVVEYPYVDKVYRDAFYNFYSSKRTAYPRDCFRVSFFSQNPDVITPDEGFEEAINLSYLGFCVLNPVPPSQFIGRNIVSPLAFKETGYELVTVEAPSSVDAMKVTAKGFPHTSQNAESMTCAESATWALMEYFGNQYPEYSTILPSEIHNIIRKSVFERQFPSKGMDLNRISFVLRKLGLGPRIYAKDASPDLFQRLLATYVESGVPTILAIKKKSGGGHAMLLIGQESVASFDHNDHAKWSNLAFGARYYRSTKPSIRKYVSIDDNRPPYRLIDLDRPCAHYGKPDWNDAEIFAFAAPLHPRVNLEAFNALKLLAAYLEYGHAFKNDQGFIQYRLFLTSSRSYKHYVRLDAGMDPTVRDKVLSVSMGKLIWVCELWKDAKLPSDLIEGVIILDATESNTAVLGLPLLLTIWGGICELNVGNKFQPEVVNLPPFRRFSNLKRPK